MMPIAKSVVCVLIFFIPWSLLSNGSDEGSQTIPLQAQQTGTHPTRSSICFLRSHNIGKIAQGYKKFSGARIPYGICGFTVLDQ